MAYCNGDAVIAAVVVVAGAEDAFATVCVVAVVIVV